ncbi:MAG: CHAT domain-containing protein [Xanthomonadales bacterium]|nr:CHAT domain-containing protein [Xanthomonadales bacterium]
MTTTRNTITKALFNTALCFVFFLGFPRGLCATESIEFNKDYVILPNEEKQLVLDVKFDSPSLISIEQVTTLKLVMGEGTLQHDLSSPTHDMFPLYFLHHKQPQKIQLAITGNQHQPIKIRLTSTILDDSTYLQWKLLIEVIKNYNEGKFEDNQKLLELLNKQKIEVTTPLGKYLLAVHASNFRQLGFLDEAEIKLQQLLNVAPENTIFRSHVFSFLASLNMTKGQHHSAIAQLQQALQINKNHSNEVMTASTFNSIGLNHYLMGNYEKAINNYLKSKVIWEKLENIEQLTRIQNNLGGAYFQTGFIQKALDMYDQGIITAQKMGDDRGLAYLKEMRAWNLETQGQFEGLIKEWHQIIELRQHLNDKPGVIRALRLLGRLYAKLGDEALALNYLKQSISEAEKITLTAYYSTTLRELAAVYVEQQNFTEGAALLQKAIKFDQAKNNQLQLASDYMAMANLQFQLAKSVPEHLRTEPLSNAIDHINQSRKIYAGSSESLHLFKLNLLASQVYTLHHQYAKANKLLIQLLQQANDGFAQFKVLTALGQLFFQQNDYQHAATYFENALSSAEKISQGIHIPVQLASFNKQTEQIRNDLILSLLHERFQTPQETSLLYKTLLISEAGKAQVLNRLIQSPFNHSHDNEQLKQAQNRFIALNNIKQNLLNQPDFTQAEVDRLQHRILMAKNELDALKESRQLYKPNQFSENRIHQLRDRLTPNQTIWAYRLDEKQSLLWEVNKQGIQLHYLPAKSKIESAITELFIFFKNNPGSRQLPNHILQIRKWLNEHVLFPIHTSHENVIVPHGLLTIYPWGLHRNSSIKLTPSLILQYQQNRQFQDNQNILVVSNPISQNINLPPLPGSTAESEWIKNQWSIDHFTWIDGEMATYANLQQELVKQPDIIHFATHGIINNEFPELSGLLLPQNNQIELLTINEISQLEINADHVVLSACDTAQGQNIDGEGLISISYAFLAAGAKQVHATLWPMTEREGMVATKEMYNEQKINPITHPTWVSYTILE